MMNLYVRRTTLLNKLVDAQRCLFCLPQDMERNGMIDKLDEVIVWLKKQKEANINQETKEPIS